MNKKIQIAADTYLLVSDEKPAKGDPVYWGPNGFQKIIGRGTVVKPVRVVFPGGKQ